MILEYFINMDSRLQSSTNNHTTSSIFDKPIQKSQLKFIMLSDIHMNQTFLEKLKVWYLDQKTFDFDYVILGGDLDILTVYDKNPSNPQYVVSEGKISSIIQYLEFFGCEIYFVPGNHDPASLFYPKEGEEGIQLHNENQLTFVSHNMHKRTKKIAQGLWIAGIGGCCQATRTDKTNNTQELIWTGFPYEKDADYQEDLDVLEKEL